ncbi:hypothetical protein ACNUDM_21425 [Vibrio chaetopteri]|uniref:hypothetical protein n=1 Tax=Vibrio chaetopteri TaxID=3016528 RepID=UPI003AB58C7C
MGNNKRSEKELIEGSTAHADELAKTRDSDWRAFFDVADKAADDFMIAHEDVIEETPNIFDQFDVENDN